MKQVITVLIPLLFFVGWQTNHASSLPVKRAVELENELREILSKGSGVYSKRSLNLFYYEDELREILNRLTKDKEIGERAKLFIRKFYPNEENSWIPAYLQSSKDPDLKGAIVSSLETIEIRIPKDLNLKRSIDINMNRSKNKAFVKVSYFESPLESINFALFFEKHDGMWAPIYVDML